VADGFRPRWSLLAEVALPRHQLTVLQRSVTRPRVTRFARTPRSLGPSAPDWPRVRYLNRRCVTTLSVGTCASCIHRVTRYGPWLRPSNYEVGQSYVTASPVSSSSWLVARRSSRHRRRTPC
jgi:hypothetical protein